jgi:hypothetical protein
VDRSAHRDDLIGVDVGLRLALEVLRDGFTDQREPRPGPVTYKNAEEKRQIIRQLPIEKLLIETDAPFLAPVPMRGKRNEPAFVSYIADKIAEIHMTTREHVARMTTANAARLFGWGG